MPIIIHFIENNWKLVAEILAFWFAYYLFFVYIKDSGMAQALKGLALLVIFFFVAESFGLKTIRWVFSYLFQISIIGFIIIFQPELRRGLARMGQSPLFKSFVKEEGVADEIVRSVTLMSRNRVGSLIAIEREVSLKPQIESGIPLDGVLTAELLTTIFMPNTPFHDGGVIVQGNRVMAVGCLFPLSQTQNLSKALGMRHRAALGMSEETDALVIVVSEETGFISLMSGGKIYHNVDPAKLKDQIYAVSQPLKSNAKWLKQGH